MSLLVYFLFHSYIIYKQINKQGIMVNVNVFYQLSSMRLLVVGECMERLKNMYTAIHMHSANEI